MLGPVHKDETIMPSLHSPLDSHITVNLFLGRGNIRDPKFCLVRKLYFG